MGDILLSFYDSGKLVLYQIVHEKPMGMSFSFNNDLNGYEKTRALDKIIEKLRKKFDIISIIGELLYIDFPAYSFKKIYYSFEDNIRMYISELLSELQLLEDKKSLISYGKIENNAFFMKKKNSIITYYKNSGQIGIISGYLFKIKKHIGLKFLWNKDVDAMVYEFLEKSNYKLGPINKAKGIIEI